MDVDARTYGVGRILSAVPGCRVLCVHLRGLGQQEMGDVPRRGECFRVRLALHEPTSEARGLRRSVELTRQVLVQLASLEAADAGAETAWLAGTWEAPAHAGQ